MIETPAFSNQHPAIQRHSREKEVGESSPGKVQEEERQKGAETRTPTSPMRHTDRNQSGELGRQKGSPSQVAEGGGVEWGSVPQAPLLQGRQGGGLEGEPHGGGCPHQGCPRHGGRLGVEGLLGDPVRVGRRCVRGRERGKGLDLGRGLTAASTWPEAAEEKQTAMRCKVNNGKGSL